MEVRESDKLMGSFATAESVRAAWDRLETWSQLVADAIIGSDPVPGR